MKYLKTIAIPLVILAVLGFALAYWSETLEVDVTVETGKLDVEWFRVTCYDNEPQGRDFGKCSYEIAQNKKEVVVKLENAYPGYNATFELTVKNTGSIPAKYAGTEADLTNLPLKVVYPVPPTPPAEPIIINPDDTYTYTLVIEVLGTAGEQQEYEVTLEVEFVQFNAP